MDIKQKFTAKRIKNAAKDIFNPISLAIVFASFSLLLDFLNADDKACVFFIGSLIMYAAFYIRHGD